MLADVQFDSRDQVVEATVTGEVDLSNATQMCDAIGEATPNTALGVVLDLSHVDYLDSAGIHLIYRLRENLRARVQKLMLAIPAESPVQDSLRLAGVTQHLPIASSVDEALVSFAPADAGHAPRTPQIGIPHRGNQRSSSCSTGSSELICALSTSSRSLSRCWSPPAGTNG
jgi:anti-sigma B factor antagonist